MRSHSSDGGAGRPPQSLWTWFWEETSSLIVARQLPQQAAGGAEEVDGRRAVGDEGGLQSQSLEHLHLEDTGQFERWSQPIRDESWTGQYLQLGPGSGHLLQGVAAQTGHQLGEALALDPGQVLLLLHLQAVHLLLVGQLLLASLRQPLELRLLDAHTRVVLLCVVMMKV